MQAQKDDKKAKQFDLHPHGHKQDDSHGQHHQHHHPSPQKDSRDDALAAELLKSEQQKKKNVEHRQHRLEAPKPTTKAAS